MIHKARIILAIPFMVLAVFFKTLYVAALPADIKEEGKTLI
tara:strand:- start:7 stop:129 length:123 start_codon:yes stop_codon:yes gene_type:complete